jgi:hypothetical protein
MRAFLVGTIIGIKFHDSPEASADLFKAFEIAMKRDGAIDVQYAFDETGSVHITFHSSEPYKTLIKRVEDVFKEVVTAYEKLRNLSVP